MGEAQGGRLRAAWRLLGREEEFSALRVEHPALCQHAGDRAANLSIQSGHGLHPSHHRLGPPSLRVSSLTSQLCSLTSQNSRGELSPGGNKSGLFGITPHT